MEALVVPRRPKRQADGGNHAHPSLATRRRAREEDGAGDRAVVVRVRSPATYPAKRRSTIDALCPPNPDEFETATPTSALRASFGT